MNNPEERVRDLVTITKNYQKILKVLKEQIETIIFDMDATIAAYEQTSEKDDDTKQS